MTKILIAGLGSIGRRHLRNLVTLGETDIVLVRSHRATLPDDELSDYPSEGDIRQALAKHRPAAVIVANPTAFHLQIAMPAAEAGCSILIEKPVSHSTEGLDDLQAAAAKSGSQLLVGFQFRFHPALKRIKEAIARGEVGRILSAHVHYGEYLPGWHPWEDYRQGYAARADLGGGVLLTQCHSLDYLPWLAGPVEAAWGFLAQLSDLELDVEDTAEIGLRFAGGPLGSVHLDYAQQPPSHVLEVTGTEGVLQCDLTACTARIYRAAQSQWEEVRRPEGWDRNDMFLDEMRHFLAVARGEASPTCSLGDGVRVMKLIAAIKASDRSGTAISV